MAQGVLPFNYEAEKEATGMTALAGLPLYLDLAKVIGLSKSIQKHLKVREDSQGWTEQSGGAEKSYIEYYLVWVNCSMFAVSDRKRIESMRAIPVAEGDDRP